jgi:hypothetical protein
MTTGDDRTPLETVLLGRVLTDPATGLPSVPYFRLIREWEERQASRRGTRVHVLRLTVQGGDERIRRSMGWRLCQEFRTSDLICSEGPDRFRLLLTSPDADHVDTIVERLHHLAETVQKTNSAETAFAIAVEVDEERVSKRCGPCEPADKRSLETPEPHEKFEPRQPHDSGRHSDQRAD